MDKPLNLTEAAAFLRCHEETLRRHAEAGQVRGVKCGGWKFMQSALIDYVRNGNQKPEDKPSWPHTGYSSPKTRKTGTSISAKSMASELDKALAPKTKSKRTPSQNIVRPNFGDKKNLGNNPASPGITPSSNG